MRIRRLYVDLHPAVMEAERTVAGRARGLQRFEHGKRNAWWMKDCREMTHLVHS